MASTSVQAFKREQIIQSGNNTDEDQNIKWRILSTSTEQSVNLEELYR